MMKSTIFSEMIFISQNNFRAKGIVFWQNNMKGNKPMEGK
jgi:hypothetical protein